MIYVDEAHPDHAYTLAPRLHPNDVTWFAYAYTENSPIEECIRETIQDSEQAYTITDDEGRLLGLFGHGVWDRPTGVGYVWLLSTEELWDDHFGDMARCFRHAILKQLDALYTAYGCTILSDNTTLARWLRMNGFEAEAASDRTGTDFTLYLRRPCSLSDFH